MAPRLRIGVVLAATGRLAQLGSPLRFVTGLLAPRLRPSIGLVLRDSCSTATGARDAVEELVHTEHVDCVVSLGGTETLPAVAQACERLRTPCVSTVLPWQFYVRAREQPPTWAFHFCWGLDDVANVFADMWSHVAPQAVVGCLWNDGPQGRALRDPAYGFLPAAHARGHRMVQATPYKEPAGDFSRQLDEFAAQQVDVVTSAAVAGDLAAFLNQAARRGRVPRLVTCSRWLTYPFDIATHGLTGITTIVYWAATGMNQSSLDGMPAAELARTYQRATGEPWLQPLGPAHALIEIAACALRTAENPKDRYSVAAALRGMNLATITGRIDWTSGPVPNVATIPIAGGQWQSDPPELTVITGTSPTARLRTPRWDTRGLA